MRLYKLEQMVDQTAGRLVSGLKLHGGKTGKLTVEYNGKNRTIDIYKFNYNNGASRLLTNEELVESVRQAIKTIESELDVKSAEQEFWTSLTGEPAPTEIEFRPLQCGRTGYQVWRAGRYYGNIKWSYDKDLWHVVGKRIEFYATPGKQKAAEQLIILDEAINKGQ